jgi:hypothetical protein
MRNININVGYHMHHKLQREKAGVKKFFVEYKGQKVDVIHLIYNKLHRTFLTGLSRNDDAFFKLQDVDDYHDLLDLYDDELL